MTEKRFQITTNPMSQSVAFDEKEKKYYIGIELEDLLNEKESIISALKEENEQLRKQLKEKEEDEQLYANEIVKLNKEAKEVLDFKSLGGDY